MSTKLPTPDEIRGVALATLKRLGRDMSWADAEDEVFDVLWEVYPQGFGSFDDAQEIVCGVLSDVDNGLA